MSLGFMGVGVAAAGEKSTTLDTVYFGMTGSEIARAVAAVGAQIEKFWTSDEISDDYENGVMIENGILTEFYMWVYSNTCVEDVPVYLSKNSSSSGFLDSQSGIYSDIIVTIPAGVTGLFSATGLSIPLVKNFHYAFVFDPNGVNPAGSIGHQQSWKSEFGNSPIMPSKYCRLNRELEMGSSDTERFFNFNRQVKTGSAANWSIPMPFNGKMSSVTISVIAGGNPTGADDWECKIYKNGSIVYTELLAKNGTTKVFDPDIDYLVGDTFAFAIDKNVAFGQSSFTNLSCGWSGIS